LPWCLPDEAIKAIEKLGKIEWNASVGEPQIRTPDGRVIPYSFGVTDERTGEGGVLIFPHDPEKVKEIWRGKLKYCLLRREKEG